MENCTDLRHERVIFHGWANLDLLTDAFRDSGIALEMPDEPPSAPESIALAGHQDKGRLLVFLVGLDGER